MSSRAITLALVFAAGTALALPPEPGTVDPAHKHTASCIMEAGPITDLPMVPANVEVITPYPGSADAPSANRVNIVFVGDGYQASELDDFEAHVNNASNYLFTIEPFKTYGPLFNVFRVDVVSVDSGVDNDPQGVFKNTALDMTYWCSGIDRALCVDVSKAMSYAKNAPLPYDQIVALANSDTYGGVGYPPQNTCTSAGANWIATEIVAHELGHSLGDLADEYDYGGPQTYTGPEPSTVNASKLQAAALVAQQKKWWRWVGVNMPQWDGMVNSFEGCNYSEKGIYRPTNNSKMRALERPFNLPNAEALIINIYKKVKPIESATPNTAPITGTPVVFAQPVQPIGNPLVIEWKIDGVVIPGATSPELDLSTLTATPGNHVLTVKLVDNTFMVKDPVARDKYLTQTRQWLWVAPDSCQADCDGSGSLTIDDFICFQTLFATQAPEADCDGSGTLNIDDFICFQTIFAMGC